MAEFDPYYKWLGIPRREQPPNHYRLLGVDQFESDKDVIQTAADRQMAYVQKCANGPQQQLSQKILNELSAARVCLLSDAKRQAYDQRLKKQLAAAAQVTQANSRPVAPIVEDDPFASFQDTETATSSSSGPAARKSPFMMPMAIASGVMFVIAAGAIWHLSQQPQSPQQSADKPAPVKKTEPSPDLPSKVVGNTDIAAAKANPAAAPGDEPAKVEVADNSTPKPAQPDPQPQTPLPTPVEPAKPTEVASVTTPPATTPAVPSSPPSNEPEKPDPSDGEKKSTTQPKSKQPTKKPTQKEAPTYELVNLPFDSVARNQNPTDPDEQPGGNASLSDLVKRAGEANKECVAISKECRPLLVERQQLMVQIVPRREAMLQAEFALKQIDAKLKVLEGRVRLESTGDPLNTQEDKLREDRGKVNGIFETARNEVATRVSRVEVLDNSLVGLSERMRKRWEDLNECRRQWLAICRPHDKYARADFEGAKRVIDEWLKVDEFWSEALSWGALIAYELGDYQTATELVEKAETLREEVLRTAKPFPQIEAMQGLVALQTQGQKSKSAGLVQKAIAHADKDSDWQTYFIAGRASEETGRLDGKAKVFLERALKIDPDCYQAAYFLGRLQTTSSEKSVRDIDAGIKLLESAWSRTGKRSWRIGFALVKAYDAAKRDSDATRQWEATLALAPVRVHEQLKKERSE